jgi:hypothetical protein
MKRRSFLKLPALLPLIDVGSAFRSAAHHFQYECVIGTSMDLTVWSPQHHVAEGACGTVCREIDRLAAILDTRDPASEISRLERSDGGFELAHCRPRRSRHQRLERAHMQVSDIAYIDHPEADSPGIDWYRSVRV